MGTKLFKLVAQRKIFFPIEKCIPKISTTTKKSDEWGKEVNEAAKKTLLPTVKHSWYLGANIPGKPQVFMPYAGGLPVYKEICDKIKDNNYEGFILT